MRPDITRFRWPRGIEEKVRIKHGLSRDEVEECFFDPRQKRLKGRGQRILLGRTDAGRHVMIVYAFEDHVVTIITARDMDSTEKRRFRRK